MGHELEMKYLCSADTAERILEDAVIAPFLGAETARKMSAVYYDTEDMRLRSMHASVRMRLEGDISVCCLKLASVRINGAALRPEYEFQAETLIDGVNALLSCGLPDSVSDILRTKKLFPFCRMEFTRCEREYKNGPLTAALSFDAGFSESKCGRREISEFEIELKSEDSDALFALCADISERFELVPTKYGKLARAFM